MAKMIRYLFLGVIILFTSNITNLFASASPSVEENTARIERIITNGTGICRGGVYRNIKHLEELNNCTVILGSLTIMIEKAKIGAFKNITFRDLREITEYMVIYRVRALESLGQLFPNLTRIRGEKLLNNYALIVYENPNLREIGLYRLLKIDRGGVIMWGLPQACFVDTIDWKALAPKARRVISTPEKQTLCNIPCSCTVKQTANRCWNNNKCQIFVEGPDADKCHAQCLGCRKTKDYICFVCRHYTYNGTCVSKCPPNSVLVPENQYCITDEECHSLGRLVLNGTCVAGCPIDYKEVNKTGIRMCEPCFNCRKTCESLMIQSLSAIQNAAGCVYVNGSITIHVRAIPGALNDLKKYLGQVQEISAYLTIEGSHMISSLDFLTSLRTIKGEKLKENKYSLDIRHNNNLQTLFSRDVLNNLKIERGTARFTDNPVLCMTKINEVTSKLPIEPTEIDVTLTNGVRGGCKEVNFDFQMRYISDTSVIIQFSPVIEYEFYYSALYARLPPGVKTVIVPETCSEFEWDSTDIPTIPGMTHGEVKLDFLRPASTYVLCIEMYDYVKQRLIRSNIFNFTTPVGIPQPPFIFELVADSDFVVIRWVNHKDYANHIAYYELDISLIEMDRKQTIPVDYCKRIEDFEADYTRHALVRRPPPEYNKGCESICGILSTVTPGAMAEDYFDICADIDFKCNNEESFISQNTMFGKYIRTLVLNITEPKNNSFQVSGLAPYSDYRFRLRACSEGKCSRSTRGVVRTNALTNPDIPTVTSIQVMKSSLIAVEWNPPKVNNGPILSYTIEVLPRIGDEALMPQSWCVQANQTSIIARSVIAPKYIVRICVSTLGTNNLCTEWRPILAPPIAPNDDSKSLWLGLGAVCGIVIYLVSFVIGWTMKRRIYINDVIPLVDSTSFVQAESEPPSLMLSDFAPFHTIPLD